MKIVFYTNYGKFIAELDANDKKFLKNLTEKLNDDSEEFLEIGGHLIIRKKDVKYVCTK
jgi:hypothetical protein